MTLSDIVERVPDPQPWAEGDNIPWHEPGFSRRMLREHLSQAHDAASRRLEIIDRHVRWIHGDLLQGQPTRILDLGCGPGLYAQRYARLGHECVGIDYSPASIDYARQQAAGADLACTYVQADIREAAYGRDFGLVTLIFGELNVFCPQDARLILAKAHEALVADGLLLLEPHTFAAVQKLGLESASWYSSPGGLFLERPHLCLQEGLWAEAGHTATIRYFVVDAASGQVTRYAQTMQAYSDDEYRALLRECGFGDVEFVASLSGGSDVMDELFAIVARKQPKG
jgi:SAM-dependent methyltransferase